MSNELIPSAQALAPAPLGLDAPRDPRYALMPTSYAEAFSMAKAFAQSGMFAVKSPEQAVVVLMTGMEMGLSPAMAMRGIDVIQGRPVPGAATLMAACLSRRDVCHYFTLISSDDSQATYRTHRVGVDAPVEMSYTIKMTENAGLLNKDNWRKNRPQMLRARSSAEVARTVYPDLCLGLYIADEAEEFAPAPPQPRPAPALLDSRVTRDGTPHEERTPVQERQVVATDFADPLVTERKEAAREAAVQWNKLDKNAQKSWSLRFAHKHGIDNIRMLSIPQMREATLAMKDNNWPYEGEYQESLERERAKKEEAQRGEGGEWDPFADPEPLLVIDGQTAPTAQKGHGDA